MLCALSNPKLINIDCDCIICGGVVENSINEAINEIVEIQKLRKKHNIITLLTKEETERILIISIVMQTMHFEKKCLFLHMEIISEFLNYASGLLKTNNVKSFDNIQFNSLILTKCVERNFDEILSMEKEKLDYAVGFLNHYFEDMNARIAHFYSCLEVFTGIAMEPVHNCELYELFSPILEVINVQYEIGDHFSFFSNQKTYPLDEEINKMMSKYPRLKSKIKTAYYFNCMIQEYGHLFIEYYQNSFHRFEQDGILYITEDLTCSESMFCELNCENQEKKVCFYNSLQNSNKKEFVAKFPEYEYVVTDGNKTEVDGRLIVLSSRSIFQKTGKTINILNY